MRCLMPSTGLDGFAAVRSVPGNLNLTTWPFVTPLSGSPTPSRRDAARVECSGAITTGS